MISVPLPCYHMSEWECYQPLKGGASDHRAFGVDVNTSTMWGRVSRNSSPKRKSVRTTNETKTSEYVAGVYRRATEYGVLDKAEAASQAAKDGRSIEETGRLLDEADKAVTRALLDADAGMIPSQRAQSHPWRSDLVTAQRKAALITKYYKVVINNKTPPRVFQLFAGQAQSIDTPWSLPERIPEVLEGCKKAIKRQAIQAKENA